MSLPKISVIVPVYNVASYLYRSLESLMQQSLNDIEIICVNDGSIDNSLDILQRYAQKDSRIRIINHEENRKLFHTRQTGFQCANGEYITSLDADDQINLETLEFCYNKLKATNADILVFGMLREELDGSRRTYRELKDELIVKNDNYTPLDKYLDGTLDASICNKIYRRNIILQTDFRLFKEKFTNNEDLIANILFFNQCNKLVTVSNIFYSYIARESSSTDIFNSEKRCSELFDNLRIGHTSLFQYLKKNDYLSIYQEKIIQYIVPEIYYRLQHPSILNMGVSIIERYIRDCPQISSSVLFRCLESKILTEKELSGIQAESAYFQQDRWYRFGQLSRKRKIWVIGKILSKKFRIYWLLKPFANFLVNRLKHN